METAEKKHAHLVGEWHDSHREEATDMRDVIIRHLPNCVAFPARRDEFLDRYTTTACVEEWTEQIIEILLENAILDRIEYPEISAPQYQTDFIFRRIHDILEHLHYAEDAP